MSAISQQQATGERLLSGGSVADPVRQQLAASLVLYWRQYRSSRSHRLSKRQFRSLHTILQATRMLFYVSLVKEFCCHLRVIRVQPVQVQAVLQQQLPQVLPVFHDRPRLHRPPACLNRQ